MSGLDFWKAAAKEFIEKYQDKISEKGYYLGVGISRPVKIYDADGRIVSNKWHIDAAIQSDGYIPEAIEMNTKDLIPEFFEYQGEVIPIRLSPMSTGRFAYSRFLLNTRKLNIPIGVQRSLRSEAKQVDYARVSSNII